MSLVEGQILSHYRVLRRIGRGGMGEVYLAVDDRLGRRVALKVLGPQADESLLARFRREAATVAALKHPHIAVLLDVGEQEGTRFFVMEYVEGESLARALQRGPMPWAQVAEHGRELASALRHAHGQGVLHRDIKPANILISASRGAVLLDFGVARWLDSHPAEEADEFPTEAAGPLSRADTVIGTVQYLSPEQISGTPLDGRSDLFQLGIVLFEAATGTHPFDGPTPIDVQHAILRDRPPAVHGLVPEAPDSFGRIVDKLLEKDPEYRYPDARALEVDLKVLLRDSTTDLPVLTGSVAVPASARNRAPWIVGLTAATVALVAWFGWLALRPAATPAMPARVVPFGEGPATSPSFSPSGDSVVFVSDRDGNADLWVRLVAGGTPVAITRTREVESQPAWSPDGTQVAFVRREAAGGRPAIHVMPALGGDSRKIIEDGIDPAWSPDGRWIAYADTRRGWVCLSRIRVDEGEERQPITDCEEGFFHRRPSFTPDGRTVVFNRSPGGWIGALMRVPVTGGPPIAITSDPAGTTNVDAAVTPDGRFVLHVSDRGGAVNLWRIPISGGTPERVTSGAGRDLAPTISPDGRRIVFVNEPLGSSVFLLDLRDGRHTLLADIAGADLWAPAVSPDGASLALSRKVPGRGWEIIAMPAAGGPPRTLVGDLDDALWVRFHPTDGTLVFHAQSGGRSRIGSVLADGSGRRWLTGDDGDASYPDVSVGGELAYVRIRDGHGEVVVRDAHGSERVVAEGATLPTFSPDGRLLAVARSRSFRGGIGVASAAAGGVTWLTASGSWPVWMPDGRRIAYADLGADGRQGAWVIAAEGGEPIPLSDFRWRGSHLPFALDRQGARLFGTDDAGGPPTLWVAEY